MGRNMTDETEQTGWTLDEILARNAAFRRRMSPAELERWRARHLQSQLSRPRAVSKREFLDDLVRRHGDRLGEFGRRWVIGVSGRGNSDE